MVADRRKALCCRSRNRKALPGSPFLFWQGETQLPDAHTTLVEGFTSSSRLSQKASLPGPTRNQWLRLQSSFPLAARALCMRWVQVGKQKSRRRQARPSAAKHLPSCTLRSTTQQAYERRRTRGAMGSTHALSRLVNACAAAATKPKPTSLAASVAHWTRAWTGREARRHSHARPAG